MKRSVAVRPCTAPRPVWSTWDIGRPCRGRPFAARPSFGGGGHPNGPPLNGTAAADSVVHAAPFLGARGGRVTAPAEFGGAPLPPSPTSRPACSTWSGRLSRAPTSSHPAAARRRPSSSYGARRNTQRCQSRCAPRRRDGPSYATCPRPRAPTARSRPGSTRPARMVGRRRVPHYGRAGVRLGAARPCTGRGRRRGGRPRVRGPCGRSAGGGRSCRGALPRAGGAATAARLAARGGRPPRLERRLVYGPRSRGPWESMQNA